ncbi:MAG: FeoB-associated Cys-rich membrane protein [Bacteroidales bacterium]|nr:FeoB-associated Cys-rich membrane protein [Bacteroidales bacterium]
MNLPTLIVLLIVAVALFFAVRSYVRAGGSSCNCGSSGCGGCTGGPDCPYCNSAKGKRAE